MNSTHKNKMTMTLVGDLEIVLSRWFEAPRGLVFEALSKPEHVRQWWGCGNLVVDVCEIDFRIGGSYRYSGTTPDGFVCPMKGEFKEIDAPRRMVFTEIFDVEPYNTSPAMVTVTLEEENERTLMTVNVLHLTKEARDGHAGSGMEHGAAMSYDRLEELAVAMKEAR